MLLRLESSYGNVLLPQVQALNLTLNDSTATINDLQERISQLQRSLTSSEHDRRVLQERLDTTRYESHFP